MTAIEIDESTRARFMKHVEPTGECWIWKGAASKAYGRFRVADKIVGAHRFAYLAWVGEIPEAGVVHHTCANTLCVNPAHLQLTTHHDNNAEMLKRKAYEDRIAVLEEALRVATLPFFTRLFTRVKERLSHGE